MKTNTLFIKTNLVICAAITLVSLSARAQLPEDKIGDVSETFKKAATEHDVSQRTGAVLDVIATHMKSNRTVVFNFFKDNAPKMDAATSSAWTELLNKSTNHNAKTAQEFLEVELTADTVSSFIAAKSAHAVDNLKVTEVDLAKASTTWDVKERENFARVLKRTAQILETTNTPTTQDAFEESLKELGYYDEYIKGCK